MIIPSLPSDLERPLVESVRPENWENLGGGLEWWEPASDALELHPDYGLVLPIRVRRRIGALVKHLARTGRPSHPSYLFAGPGGAGKSVVVELLARTFLAEEHENVGYNLPTGSALSVVDFATGKSREYRADEGERVTFIDETDGLPYRINPVDKGRAKRKYVRRALARPGDTTNQTIQYWNAGTLNKAAVDDIASTLRFDMSMIGRRVIVVSEIDQLEKRQTVSLKGALDPKDMPEGLLFLADTNEPDTVEKNFDKAGFQRFHLVEVPAWRRDQLTTFAMTLGDYLGLTFDQTTFADEEEPYAMLADRACGAMRVLLETMQAVRHLPAPITKEELEKIVLREDTSSMQTVDAAFTFVNQVVNRGNASEEDVVAFVRSRVERRAGLLSFVNSLSALLLSKYPGTLLEADVHEAMIVLARLVGHTGEPAFETLWTAATGPLTTIARALSTQTRRRK